MNERSWVLACRQPSLFIKREAEKHFLLSAESRQRAHTTCRYRLCSLRSKCMLRIYECPSLHGEKRPRESSSCTTSQVCVTALSLSFSSSNFASCRYVALSASPACEGFRLPFQIGHASYSRLASLHSRQERFFNLGFGPIALPYLHASQHRCSQQRCLLFVSFVTASYCKS